MVWDKGVEPSLSRTSFLCVYQLHQSHLIFIKILADMYYLGHTPIKGSKVYIKYIYEENSWI